jgi:hypothetical protein
MRDLKYKAAFRRAQCRHIVGNFLDSNSHIRRPTRDTGGQCDANASSLDADTAKNGLTIRARARKVSGQSVWTVQYELPEGARRINRFPVDATGMVTVLIPWELITLPP